MRRLGRFFAVNRLGRWVNQHFHGLIHRGKGGPYAFRVALDEPTSCPICHSVAAFVAPYLRDR
jgi:hypothetical protein